MECRHHGRDAGQERADELEVELRVARPTREEGKIRKQENCRSAESQDGEKPQRCAHRWRPQPSHRPHALHQPFDQSVRRVLQPIQP